MFLLLFLPSVQSLACSPDTEAALLFDDFSENTNFISCFRQCALRNCTGVLLAENTCISLNTADFYGPLDIKRFVEKKCIPGLTNRLLIKKSTNRVLIGQTEKVVRAVDEFDCARQCYEEKSFQCQSTMFYGDVNDCFLNYANSSAGQMSNDTDGFSVDFFEFATLSEEICGKKKGNMKGFTLIPSRNQVMIRGDVEIVESGSVEECLDGCESCDFAVFDEKTSSCQRVFENLSGQEISNSENGAMFFERLCRTRRAMCGGENSVYVMRDGLEDKMREECLTSCLNSPNCTYVYSTKNGCLSSDKSLHHLPRILERKCIKKMPKMENGIIFEESAKCFTGALEKIEKVTRNECFVACFNHPNKSCGSISYHRETALCELFEIDEEKFSSEEKCHHYELSVFSLEEELIENSVTEIPSNSRSFELPIKKISGQKSLGTKNFPLREISGDSIKREEFKPIKAVEKSEKKSEKLFEEIQAEPLPEISVKPICRFDIIFVEIHAEKPFNGTVFPRNLHEKCSMKIVNGKGNLSLELGEQLGNNSRCTAEYDEKNDLYKTVLIVKSKSDDGRILTEDDRLFHISCKYRGNQTVIAKSKPLGIEPPSAKDLAVRGIVSSPKQMSLKTIGRSTPEIVQLGEPIQLNFADPSLKGGFNLDKCYATDSKGSKNISLVQYGCTVSGNDNVVTHRIRYQEDGFTFAIKAFKFADGESVRITCLVRKCEECKRPTCHQIAKRSLNETLSAEDPADFQELVAELFVQAGKTKRVL
ncbi:unnamed protein product, partial [Mesorhabditis belari]|uniref:Uncharacterized protein n=1 Tax=Mesorhabditis belari TaxID=2138241 RepID=A0AAF3EY43_9BILA